MTPGPADEARRALREAREHGTENREGGAPGQERAADGKPVAESGAGDESMRNPHQRPEHAEASETPDPGGARPADAARAALRRAISAKREAGGTDRATDAGTSGAESGGLGGDVSGVASGGKANAEGAARAAIAALRAAQAESRQARVDAERAGAEARRRPRRAADGSRGEASRRAAGVQGRDLGELLADSFRMPSPAAGPGQNQNDNDPAPKRSSGSRTSSPASTPTSGEGPQAAWSAEHLAEVQRPGTAHSAPIPSSGESPTGPTALRPHSMAAPARDSELRRTFPAFPPRASGSPASPASAASPADAGFAETWWGNAWVTALEEGALDAKRLARGRSYAEQGHVDAITVTPGLVLAYVQGSRPRPYRVQVRLRTLDDADWARFLDAAAERPGHIAALLDKELPQTLVDCGVPLLPGPRDLDPHCSCPDRGHPCKHAAALCYQTARLLDADPFVLLLLRGRGERELLDALSRLSATRAARAAQEQEPAPLPGVRATQALLPRQLPPLPAPLPVPPHPEQPPVYPAAPGGPDPFALDQLATDAAARAHALLSTGRDPVAELTLWQDAVRLAAARPGSGLTAGTRALYASLASAAGRTPAELARAVAAWRQGGLEGLAVLEEPWDPPAGRFDRARPLLLAADLPAFRPWHNHLTHPRGHVQLRLGRDGLWYAYESEPGHDDWWPRGTPDLDPVGALTGLGTPNDL